MSTSTGVPRSQVFPRRRAVGFTLIELMVTVAVAVILSVIAVPSFRQFILNQRIKNASYDVISALTLARSEAITRNTNVHFKHKTGGWANGWCVTTDSACGTTNQLVTHEAFNTGISIAASAAPTTITYGPGGRPTTAATVFTIKPATDLNGVKVRCVAILLSGVPRSTEVASEDDCS